MMAPHWNPGVRGASLCPPGACASCDAHWRAAGLVWFAAQEPRQQASTDAQADLSNYAQGVGD